MLILLKKQMSVWNIWNVLEYKVVRQWFVYHYNNSFLIWAILPGINYLCKQSITPWKNSA